MRTSKKSVDGFLLAKLVVEVKEFGILESLWTFKDVLQQEVLSCCSTIGITVARSKDTRIEGSVAGKLLWWCRDRPRIKRLKIERLDGRA